MDIVIKGPGEAVICFIDSEGRTLILERLRCSGSPGIGARRPVGLVCKANRTEVSLVPVLVSNGEKQQVTFDGEQPASFTKKRCREIGCPDELVDKARQRQAQLLRADPANVSDREQYRLRP